MYTDVLLQDHIGRLQMIRRLFVCVVLVVALLGSLTLIGSGGPCWPCESDAGCPLPGYTLISQGYCLEVRYNRCQNNQCKPFNPLYDDCYVRCWWRQYANLLETETCVVYYDSYTFCAQ
jgi:hypothetical protein